jgi:hypothetical protein
LRRSVPNGKTVVRVSTIRWLRKTGYPTRRYPSDYASRTAALARYVRISESIAQWLARRFRAIPV